MKWISVKDIVPKVKHYNSKYYVESDPVFVNIVHEILGTYTAIYFRTVDRTWYPNDKDVDYNAEGVVDFYWIRETDGIRLDFNAKITYWMPLPKGPNEMD